MDEHDTRLLRGLLSTRPVAALGTLHGGEPAVSMVPFVLPAGGTQLLIHVSALAPHSRDIQAHARVALLVTAEADGSVSPLALPRVALQAEACFLPRESEDYRAGRAAYLQRFADAATPFELADFALVALQPLSARLVAGFGRAQALVGPALERWLQD